MKGLSKKTKQTTTHRHNNNMVITGGKGGSVEGKWAINGDGRRLDLG